jgi:hypothetical protein
MQAQNIQTNVLRDSRNLRRISGVSVVLLKVDRSSRSERARAKELDPSKRTSANAQIACVE